MERLSSAVGRGYSCRSAYVEPFKLGDTGSRIVTVFDHEAGFERDYTRGQTPFSRHHQVCQGMADPPLADHGTALELRQRLNLRNPSD